IRTVRGWKLFQWTLTNPASAAVVGINIDELRLYPENAVVKSMSYTPYIGVIGMNDPNNNVTYYEYDAHNRLLRVRDLDNNILKQVRYKNQDTVIRCTNYLASWTATGLTRCVKNANNNNTAEQREERDLNNCSPTYLQYRWFSLGITSNCPTVANCTGLNKRVVNGVCETGIKVYNSTENHGSYWTCYFNYEFSDGYVSPTYQENNPVDCGVI
ncbi:MAG: hypothetical protein EOO88_62590, partial [Pedobacter sp.]